MYWSVIDERLIRRGELLLSLGFLEGYDAELMDLNSGKVGRPFKITGRYVEFLMVVLYLFSMPYRQLEGFTRALNRLIPKLPSAGYSWIRRRTLTLNLSLSGSLRCSSEPIAVDSRGVSVHKSGEWVTRVHGKKKRYIKIHFAVDVKTKEVVAVEATTDDVHDLEALPSKMPLSLGGLLEHSWMELTITLKPTSFLKPIIKSGLNARADRGPPKRSRTVRLIRRVGDEG